MIEVLLYILIAFGSMVAYGVGMAAVDHFLDEGWDHPSVVLWPVIVPFLLGGFLAHSSFRLGKFLMYSTTNRIRAYLDTRKEKKKLPKAKARLGEKDG